MIFKSFLGLATLLGALSAYAAANGTSTDRAVLAGYDAFRRGSPIQLEKHAEALRGHVLEPYADYWRLKLQLEDAGQEDVSAFFAQHPGTYVAEMLRADWLRVLGKRRDWERFDAEFGLEEEPDPEIRCYALAARFAQGDQEAAAKFAGSIWREHGSLPEGCTRLAEQLIDAGLFTVTDIWARVRVLFEYGEIAEAKRALGYLPRDEVPNERDLRAAAKQPARLLARKPLRLERRSAR
jgi:soluble lytic murein transglycosylase